MFKRLPWLQRCDGKVKDIYKSKELWRGPESIYRKEVVLALSGDKRWRFNMGHIRLIGMMSRKQVDV